MVGKCESAGDGHFTQRRGTQDMELRTPAPLSDDEIYHFAETAQPTAPSSTSPSDAEQSWVAMSPSTPTPRA